jgi:hypothetical protein
MYHVYCHTLSFTKRSAAPTLAKANVRKSSGTIRASLQTGHAMGLNTNSKRNAEVFHKLEARGVV